MEDNDMARRTFTMVDLVELYTHWYAGRSITEVADSLGVDRKTVRKYVAVATSAGLSAGGPAMSDTEWRAHLRAWFPELVDTRLRQPSWGEIARNHDYIKDLVGVVPLSVIHQRLSDEAGLEASVASVRRYVAAHFPEEQRPSEVELYRPPVDPGDEAQIDYCYLGTWFDPALGRTRRVWALSMGLSYSRHLFVRPVVSMDQRSWTDPCGRLQLL
jgi:transposase